MAKLYNGNMNGCIEPDINDPLKPESQFSIAVSIIKLIVFLFDIITFPFYYLIQRPWVKLANQQRIRAVLENPNDPYSSYINVDKHFNNHYVLKAQTIPESQQLTLKLNSKHLPLLGRRNIVDVVREIRNGKEFLKFKLTDYEWLTLEQVNQKIGELTRGFVSEGVKYQEKILIFSETRMEWFLCAQALFRMGAIVTTLYTSLGVKSICHGIQEIEVEQIITTSDLLPVLLKIIKEIKQVKKIYVIEVHPGIVKYQPLTENDFNKVLEKENRQIKLITYENLLKIGSLKKENDLEYTRPSPSDTAVILYTSGSTGNPKGAILTHKSFILTIHAAYSMLERKIIDEYESHCYYGVLPLAHCYELIIELACFGIGIKIAYGTPYTMTDSSTAIIKGDLGDLRMVKPTLMACVPLLLDRIRKMITESSENSIFKKQFIKFLVEYKNKWLDRGFDTPLMNRFICKRLRKNLGGNVCYMISSGAPLSPETHRIIRSLLNIRILTSYGATETCGPTNSISFDDLCIGYIGQPLPDVKIRLIDWPEGGYSVHDKPYPRGELVIGGPKVSNGYFKLSDQTNESFEEKDGIRWFKMGDIGEVNNIGIFKIIDRKKDLVKLQFGEYISLGKVETELKNFNYIENVCIYGDSLHTYVIALISPVRHKLNTLAIDFKKTDLSFEELCNDKKIISHILKELKEFCLEVGLHKMETPQKIKLCPEEWTVSNGFLTPSLKISRRKIQNFYEKTIQELYDQ